MRKLILQEFISLDGMISGPGGSLDFIPASTQSDQSFGREQLALMQTVDTILLGRATYQMFAGYWPNIVEGDEQAFAKRVNETPKVVFSSTLDRALWGKWDEASIVKGPVAEKSKELKRAAGRDILVWGSISLAQCLLKEGLVDEYRPVLCPVVLGSGRPLFAGGIDQTRMHLRSATPLDRGALSLQYAIAV